jgi:hypothetical protein
MNRLRIESCTVSVSSVTISILGHGFFFHPMPILPIKVLGKHLPDTIRE